MSTTTSTNSPAAAASPSRGAWSLVARREMAAKLRDRNFIVGTLIMLALILAAMVLPVLFLGDGADDSRVAVTDDAGMSMVQAASASGQESGNPFGGSQTAISPVRVADRAAAAAAVRSGDADVGLVRTGARWELLADGNPPLELSGLLASTVKDETMAANADKAGTSLEKLSAGGDLVTVDLAAGDTAGDGSTRQMVSFAVGMGFAFLFYMAAIMFGMQIATSVVEEKQSRIVEILAAMIPLRQLLLGKVVGNTLIAFGQILLMAATAVLGIMGLAGGALLGGDAAAPAAGADPAAVESLPIDIGGLVAAICWYVPFFVLGFVALACIWAAAGAMASRNEDLQATTMPLTMSIIVVFFAAIYSTGTLKQVLSFVPVVSTILMPMRIVEGDYVWWEPVLALLLVVAFAAVTVWFGARLYERAVMHTSGALTWRQAVRVGP